ncbi:MAG TPA: hypothetical protein VHH34_05050 [Pseudonocardiaceae bacterium]|nr:hypothetical protein [Pseudonocardiaceae bacterium]
MVTADVLADVEIKSVPREPVTDPTLGIPVATAWHGTPAHRLVSIGDSLTHGFASGAVSATDLSYSAIIAHELGWAGLRFPRYEFGGLPLNIELLLRELEQACGTEVSWWELPVALQRARRFLSEVEEYWEVGPGSRLPVPSATTPGLATNGLATNHVLAVYGWDLRDVLVRTADSCAAEIQPATDDLVDQIVQNHGVRAALRVLPRATPADRQRTVLEAAAELGRDTDATSPGRDPDHGIETLVVFLGANNALSAITKLNVTWSGPGFDDVARKGEYTVWRPSHFSAELAQVVAEVRRIRARHVIWCTVPHVTIAPIARGVHEKVRPGSAYFPYYTRPWISDQDFDPARDPAITGEQAHTIDSAIDQYNDAITAAVAAARRDGRDWYLLDLAGALDRLASRRYLEDPRARPDWWEPYPLPAELAGLAPVPDSRFLTGDERGRRTGGLFSLDGVHPTTVGYGLIAQEIIDVMVLAGVQFGSRNGTVRVDFNRLIQRDTLITTPPPSLTDSLQALAWADNTLDLLRRIF